MKSVLCNIVILSFFVSFAIGFVLSELPDFFSRIIFGFITFMMDLVLIVCCFAVNEFKKGHLE